MKKLSLFLAILIVTVFCACDEKNAPVTEDVFSQTTVSQTTTEAKTTTAPSSTTIPETTETADNEPDFSTLDGIQKYLNQLARDSYEEYTIADLDQNGYPEIICLVHGTDYYSPRALDVVELNGKALGNNHDLGNVLYTTESQIQLYRGKNENYFYVSNYVWGDGGISSSTSSMGIVNNEGILAEIKNIAYFSNFFPWSSEDTDVAYITDNYVGGKLVKPYGFTTNYIIFDFTETKNNKIPYKNELNKYLSQYELVTTVNVGAIWSIDDEYNVRIKKIDEAVNKFRGLKLMDGVNFTKFDEEGKEYITINGEKIDKRTNFIFINLTSNNFDLSILDSFPNLRSVNLYSKDEVTVDISPIFNNLQIIELCLDGDIHVNTGEITESKNLKMINAFNLDNIEFVAKLKSVDYAYIEPDYNNTDKNYFKPLYSLPNLKWFELNGMGTSVTTEQREEMKKNMPDCIFSSNKIG